ncbi:hypothetical protein PIB30_005169 [Stylosanthes scabra]|uniref:Uncharacterized protein n=1 Tax=Stylosanthes scabra TaxID=79078 RepID=A0ABU6R2T4_9FABA|nr:hypothetical protein [Stylosanthes scabra]
MTQYINVQDGLDGHTNPRADPSPLILQWWSLITILTAAHHRLITLASNISSEVAFYFAVAVVTSLAPCYVDRRRPCYFDRRRSCSVSSISSARSMYSARLGSSVDGLLCRHSSSLLRKKQRQSNSRLGLRSMDHGYRVMRNRVKEHHQRRAQMRYNVIMRLKLDYSYSLQFFVLTLKIKYLVFLKKGSIICEQSPSIPETAAIAPLPAELQ